MAERPVTGPDERSGAKSSLFSLLVLRAAAARGNRYCCVTPNEVDALIDVVEAVQEFADNHDISERLEDALVRFAREP